MKHLRNYGSITFIIITLFLYACHSQRNTKNMNDRTEKSNANHVHTTQTDTAQNVHPKVLKSDADWKQELSPETYQVARCGGTERAFTGIYYDHKEPGIYKCVCCKTPLFASTTKYDSGSGWPSFYAPVNDTAVGKKTDRSHGMLREEIVCNHCGAHLGHVFDDGPQPTGQRYCVNSLSLDFEGTQK